MASVMGVGLNVKDLTRAEAFYVDVLGMKVAARYDVAKFKEFSVKRSEAKKSDVWYILTCASGEITNFQQPEADRMITAIHVL